MGNGLDFLLQNAPLPLVERVEVERRSMDERDGHISLCRPAELIVWIVEMIVHLSLSVSCCCLLELKG